MSSPDEIVRDQALSELWVLMNAALVRYARQHGRPYPGVSDEDLNDVARAKALDLFQKLTNGTWDPSVATPGQICAFLSTVARHGLVDFLRSKPRRVFVPIDGVAAAAAASEGRQEGESPLVAAERAQFTRALCECIARFTPRARRVWLFRTYLELSGREIARHPDIQMNPAAVDVALARCRHTLRRCLRSRGYSSRDLPRGTFFALWEAVSHELDREG